MVSIHRLSRGRTYLPSLSITFLFICALAAFISVVGTRGASKAASTAYSAAIDGGWGGVFPAELESFLRGGGGGGVPGPAQGKNSTAAAKAGVGGGEGRRRSAVGSGESSGAKGGSAEDDPDADCPFRSSSLYRSVYVYPTYNDTSSGWTSTSPILSSSGRNGTIPPWPWLAMDERTRRASTGHYDITGQVAQYALELIVREIMTHPKSCLRASNPEDADLFYVPYLPSMEFHDGRHFGYDYSTSKYAQAVYDAIEGNYRGWEDLFGLTSKYWKRRSGSDHILVFSEPLHGLSHPRSRRGHHHYIHTQRQLRPPIVISVELSTAFIQQYPMCASKNIVAPYPEPDGQWYNGQLDVKALELRTNENEKKKKLKLLGDVMTSNASLSSEREIAAAAASSLSSLLNRSVGGTGGGEMRNSTNADQAMTIISTHPRPLTHFYSAGGHGECANLRRTLQSDLRCTPSSKALLRAGIEKNYRLAMRQATFCPCPGGDSPSAKRMFDAIIAGCIPVILSEDFVWPFSTETELVDELGLSGSGSGVGRERRKVDPREFSLRWKASDYVDRRYDNKCNKRTDAKDGGLQEALEKLSSDEIRILRDGVNKAAGRYSFYKRGDTSLPQNPLREGILPNGGAAHEIVRALEERVRGRRWKACEEELRNMTAGGTKKVDEPRRFRC